MKFWILVMAAVVLLVWSLTRERFEATPSIQAPPYDDAAKLRIFDIAPSGMQNTLLARASGSVSVPSSDPGYDRALKVAAGGLVAPVVGEFFTTVFRPATVPITDAEVTAFMASRTSDIKDAETQILKAYFVGQQGIGTSMAGGENSYAAALSEMGQNPGYLVDSPGGGGPRPVCPAGLIGRAEDGRCVNADWIESPSCPADYRRVAADRCQRVGGTETTGLTCSAGLEYNSSSGTCDTLPVDPTCPSGYTFGNGMCERKTAAPAASGSTTGGSSVSTFGPTTGGPSSRIRQVFGPQFAGSGGDLSGKPPGDSSQTNVYPELLGGMIDSSSRIPGAGIVAPSKNYTLTKDGSLPPSNTMGSDEMSRYFPFSRSPGDMDVIPDPYRVAQTFSASSYSSKTEPVPFLTDFSAFQK